MNPILNDMTETPQAGISFKSRMKEMRNQEDVAQIILALFAGLEKQIKEFEDPIPPKEKLLSELKRVSSMAMNLYRSQPDKFSLAAIRERNRAVARGLKKNQYERKKYRDDENYRTYKKLKMREWRTRPGNAAREESATMIRRNAPIQTVFEL